MNFIPVALAAEGEIEIIGSIPGFLMNLIFGGIGLVVTFFLATFLRAWAQRIISKKKIAQHDEMRILYGRVAFTATLSVGIVISLTIIGAPLEWFTGGIGLGAAFAFRGILANFFAGMILLSNTKFNIGDFVILNPDKDKDGGGDISGTIVDIQSRATSLRGYDGGEITVPNTKMIDSIVKCFTKNPIRRHVIEIGVGFNTNIEEAVELLKKTVAADTDVQSDPPVTILTSEISNRDNTIILKVRFWTESRLKWWIIKSKITQDIFNALNKAEINIPYPIQTLRVDEDSSGLLAKNPNFLENLGNIEKTKKLEQPSLDKNSNELGSKPAQLAPSPNLQN